MKNIILILVALILVSCDNSMIGKYKKEQLPSDFNYSITEDNSNNALEKNQLTIEINMKITVGQIATLADELYKSKPEQRRFYIFYNLKGMDTNKGAWATSHFDPELEIQILGSTEEQDNKTANVSDISGEIIGKWRSESSLMGAVLVLYKDSNGKLNMKITFKDGSSMTNEISEETKQNMKILKDGNSHGEYYIIEQNGNLGMYGNNGKFDEAKIIK